LAKSINEPASHFYRAASAEFNEAITWYESKRCGLGLEFIAEIDRCVSLASEHPLQFAIDHENIRRVIAKHFPYCVYFVRNNIALLSWRYFMDAEIPQFGWREPNPAFARGCAKARRPYLTQGPFSKLE